MTHGEEGHGGPDAVGPVVHGAAVAPLVGLGESLTRDWDAQGTLYDHATGTAVELADGQTWLLADFVPVLGPAWDQLIAAGLRNQPIELPLVWLACRDLLLFNHSVPADGALMLVRCTPTERLMPALNAALVPAEERDVPYSLWARSVIRVAGLDPARVPPDERGLVLSHLVASGRAIPFGMLGKRDVDTAGSLKVLESWGAAVAKARAATAAAGGG